MLNTIIGILIGFAVCLFGMWCYIKGEQNGLKLANKEQPQQIETPVQVISEGVEAVKAHIESKKDEKKALSQIEQVKNLLNY